jgi:hypothetical protein
MSRPHLSYGKLLRSSAESIICRICWSLAHVRTRTGNYYAVEEGDLSRSLRSSTRLMDELLRAASFTSQHAALSQ